MLKNSTIKGLMNRSALFVIDMQHDFLDADAPYACRNTEEVIGNIALVSRKMRAQGVPVVYTREVHRRDGVDRGREADSEPIHCIEGTHGVEIVPELAPLKGDYIIDKRRFSSFFQTELLGLLKGLGTELIIVSGVTARACVLATVIDAFQHDYHTITIQECVTSQAGLLVEENYTDLLDLYRFYSTPMHLNAFLSL